MKISVAQTHPIKGNVYANICKHRILIDIASSFDADAIFFPELSLTGYEPNLANELATDIEDLRFRDFQQISDNNKISIGVGMPTTNLGVEISMIVFQPKKPRLIYSKQQLHVDELPYFEKVLNQVILEIGNKKIAPAICYESLIFDHSDRAVLLGAEVDRKSVV